MGTNYYIVYDPCITCGKSDDRLHIGKLSFGWRFALHVYPEKGIHVFEDWKSVLQQHANNIQDEYGKSVTLEDMLTIILRLDASKQPELLLGREIDDHFCIGRGDGLYDYCVGEFS